MTDTVVASETISHSSNGIATGESDAKTQMKVLVIGAGLCGLATAIGLCKAGLRVTVLERSDELREEGAGIQIPPNAGHVLSELGVFDSVKDISVKPQKIDLYSYTDGSTLTSLNIDPHAQQSYGRPLLVTHRADLCKILYQKAVNDGAEVRFSCDIQKIDFSEPAVGLSNGESITADLIIGADGSRSVCRERLAGKDASPKPTGELVYRISLDLDQVRKDPLLRGLIEPSRLHLWLGPLSHVVCYGLKGILNVVMILPGYDGTSLDVQPANLDQLLKDFQAWEPRVRRIIELAQSALKWPQLESVLIDKWTNKGGTFALVGDAACTVLPSLAQGAAVGFESALMLASLVAKAKSLDKIPQILEVYSLARQKRTARVHELSRVQERAFQLEDGSEQAARDRKLQDGISKGSPFFKADAAIESWLWGFRAKEEADRLWAECLSTESKNSTADNNN